MRFFHAEWGDETHALPASFSGSSNGDGVAISADGTNWFTILTNTDPQPGVWVDEIIDLAAAATSAGIALGPDFKIKFQQYDNWIYSSDGRAYDQISIVTPQASPDWYSFEILSGQTVSLALSGDGTGGASVDLYDASETLLQSGVSGSNVDSYVSRYTNAGATATFYAYVTGPDNSDYDLVVTRGADFDLEPSGGSAPQAMSDNGGVFGHVSAVSSADADPDSVAATTVINTAFPGLTLSNNVGGGSIYSAEATFTAPTGANVFAPGATADNGFREGDNELRADFAISQSFVSIDVGSDDASDVAWLRAYDSNNVLLDEVVSGSVANGNRQTISLSRPTADIAYIVAAGSGSDITPLDRLVYQVADSNSDVYTISAIANDQFTLNAFLPGAGQNLFNNPLDAVAGSLLLMELRDPNGTLIATDNESISATAALSGDYELTVIATASGGEYFVEHWYNHAPEAVTDAAETDEDELLNIDALVNDSDVDGDSHSITGVTTPAHGTAVIQGDGTIDYMPVDDYFGDDSFEYTLTDEHGAVSTGTVNVTVKPINDAPTNITLSANSIAENTDTSSGAVSIGTLTAEDTDSTSFTYNLVAGTGDADNSSFEVVGNQLAIKQGVVLDFESQSQYAIRLEVSDGDLTYEKEFVVDVTDLLEVGTLTIGNGSQRSSILELVIAFNDVVTISPGAFGLLQRGGNGGSVTLNESSSDATGVTVVTLTFSGSFVETGGSLADGNYQLTIDGSLIQSASTGQLMDGDSDGVAGGNYVFGDTEDDAFFRLYADIDGDRDVDGLDFGQFRPTFFKSSGDANYNRDFDFDNDGDVDGIDFGQFRIRFFTSLDFE